MVYRSKAEMDEWKGRDPVVAFRARLLDEAHLPEADVLAVERAVQAMLDEAVSYAAASPKPAPETALAGVYGETHDGRVF
jgi:pyruvate dehydrogenase E1 component alpha subunit